MTFSKVLADSAPAPHWETPEYLQFSNVFAPVAFFGGVALSYALVFLFGAGLEDATRLLVHHMPFLLARLAFLRSADGYSHIPYIATIISGLIFVPTMLIVNGIGYWKTVVSHRRCRKVVPLTTVVIGMGISVFGAMLWIAFVYCPLSYQQSRPGMVRILFWPIFPIFGSGVVFLSAIIGFSILVGVAKFAWHFGGRYGRFK
jgi:hypothetical protein